MRKLQSFAQWRLVAGRRIVVKSSQSRCTNWCISGSVDEPPKIQFLLICPTTHTLFVAKQKEKFSKKVVIDIFLNSSSTSGQCQIFATLKATALAEQWFTLCVV
jgi:hypothetical protein